MSTIQELKIQATDIQNETVPESITGRRVGKLFLDILQVTEENISAGYYEGPTAPTKVNGMRWLNTIDAVVYTCTQGQWIELES